MDKINFQNGTKTSNAKITIDGVDYIVTPAQYQGGTPISATVLNTLQNNIEAALNDKLNKTNSVSSGSETNGKIEWEETGYGDKFMIVPSFTGADDANKLLIKGAVGGANTDPAYQDLVEITAKNGNVKIKGDFTSNVQEYNLADFRAGELLKSKYDPIFEPNYVLNNSLFLKTSNIVLLNFAISSVINIVEAGESTGVKNFLIFKFPPELTPILKTNTYKEYGGAPTNETVMINPNGEVYYSINHSSQNSPDWFVLSAIYDPIIYFTAK